MDPDPFSAVLFKWDGCRPPHSSRLLIHDHMPAGSATDGHVNVVAGALPAQDPTRSCVRTTKDLHGLEELFHNYGIRYFTMAKMAEMGFTANTLLNMKDEELEEMMATLVDVFRWDLLVGERYGIKAAVRAERQWFFDATDAARRRQLLASPESTTPLDALSQEESTGLSEEGVHADKVGVVAGGGDWPESLAVKAGKKQRRKRGGGVIDSGAEDSGDRQREHPFVVTEAGEVARGKKNGLDYLFHLYEECRAFLIQVQNMAKERGEKCPTKVTNQVFRYAKMMGATYINKPKMRHYVHCYALHCLDRPASDRLRHVFKERGENVGAWRQACYQPLVTLAAHCAWDIDAMFNSNEKLCIWYVPTKLRQFCHQQRTTSSSSLMVAAAAAAATGRQV